MNQHKCETLIKCWLENMKRDNLGDLGTERKIILKRITRS